MWRTVMVSGYAAQTHTKSAKLKSDIVMTLNGFWEAEEVMKKSQDSRESFLFNIHMWSDFRYIYL